MPKLLVLDIDGTLLNSEDIVTPVVKRAIAEARSEGVEVALATGRRVGSTRRVVLEIGIELPLVTFNGALVWDTHTESAIRELPFTREMLIKVAELCRAVDVHPVMLQGPTVGERIVTPRLTDDRPAYFDWFLDPRINEVDQVSYDELIETPGVLTIDAFGPGPALEELASHLSALEVQVYDVGQLDWEAHPPQFALNLHMAGATKANGVKVLADRIGCTMADVVAIGDGYNDMPLLEAAGVGVAMGNAPDHVKRSADAVVVGHDDDGVAEAIERFILTPLRATP